MASRLPRNRKVTIYSLWELLSNIHAKVKGNQWLDQLSSQGAKDTGRKFCISAAKENPILSKLFWTKQTSSVLESDKIPIWGELLIRKNSMLSVISDNPLTFPGLSEKICFTHHYKSHGMNYWHSLVSHLQYVAFSLPLPRFMLPFSCLLLFRFLPLYYSSVFLFSYISPHLRPSLSLSLYPNRSLCGCPCSIALYDL